MERDLVRWLCERLPLHARLLVGPGDDAAILRSSAGANIVATTDMLMEGVDFELARHSAEQIGRKALAVNLSDLAAMAASPVAVLVSLALPRQHGAEIAQRLYEGLLPLAAEFDCPVAGGDTNSWDGPLVISVTALGELPPHRQWLRSGARPGDAILVTGQFGGSILGRQFTFTPRIKEALWLAENVDVHAALDVSDGLSLDLSRMGEASGCGAELELASVPISTAAKELARERNDGSTPLDRALSDGEDFELVLATSEETAAGLLKDQPLAVPLTRIGQFISQPGLFARDAAGSLQSLPPRGYEHRLDA